MIAVASITTGACMVGLFFVQNSWQFLGLFTVMGLIGLSAPGGLLTSVPVAKWFVRQRGRALAIATMGLGMGGIAFMPITQILIDGVGWRSAWLVLALVSMTLTAPLALIFLRKQPEDMGLLPDGRAHVNPNLQREQPKEEIQWTAAQAMKTRTFWRLILFFGLLGLAAGGGSIHRLPYWVEQGFDASLVSYAFAADAAGAALMALAAGFMVDRFPVRYVGAVSSVGFAVAIGLMFFTSHPFFLFASVILFGISVGANMIVTTFRLGRLLRARLSGDDSGHSAARHSGDVWGGRAHSRIHIRFQPQLPTGVVDIDGPLRLGRTCDIGYSSSEVPRTARAPLQWLTEEEMWGWEYRVWG